APSIRSTETSWISLWFLAMGGAFWAYDGWGNIAYVGGEVRNPKKNLPLAILLGTGLVIAIYVLVNLAYIYVLPIEQIGDAPGNRVASSMMNTVLGQRGVTLIAALILLSTFDTVNSSILTNARVYFAMAKDRLFWDGAGVVHPTRHTPSASLWLQGLWSVILLVSGSFDLITSMYVFVNWAFYLMIPISLFVLRKRKQGEYGDTFKVPFYPLLPLGFALFTAVYLIQTLVVDIQAYRAHTQPCIKSLMGIALVLSGLPFYIYLRNSRKTNPRANH
ncbi:MAG: amino acid permease, partial [Bdellovibrionota bacterium]